MEDSNYDLDEEFRKQAELAEEYERAKAAEKTKPKVKKPTFNANFPTWSGLETGVTKVVRAFGSKPHFGIIPNTKPGTNIDARVVNISKIVSDKKRWSRIILPLLQDNPDFIIWRIIAKINEPNWELVEDKKLRYFPALRSHPELYNQVNYNGFAESSNERKFDLLGKGWKGREVFVFNAIDRAMSEWHSEHNHSILIAKDVNKTVKDGKENIYVQEGIPAYGFTSIVQSLTGTYGFWEKYDIGIKRTGKTSPPYEVCNATRTSELCTKGTRELVVKEDSLSDVEKNYELYDLDKIFHVTEYSKLYNNLKDTIAEIDAAFHTHFLDELQSLMEDELKNKEESQEDMMDTTPDPTLSQRFKEATTLNSDMNPSINETMSEDLKTAIDRSLTEDKVEEPESIKSVQMSKENLPGYADLTSEERDMIVSAIPNPDELLPNRWQIVYLDPTVKTLKCGNCGTKSPKSFKYCPGCGSIF